MWRASQTGPDMGDLTNSAQAIGDFHNVDLTTTLRWVSAGEGTQVNVTTRATQSGEAGLGELAFVEITSKWPTPNHKSIEGLLYGQLIQLEIELAAVMWVQSQFKPE